MSKATLFVIATAATMLSASQFAAVAAGDTPANEAASGHCNYTLKNQWAGPLKVCMEPATAAACAEAGRKDENSGAVWGEGGCSTAGVVGSCKTASSTLRYYEGDASGLEIGCGFQSGEWSSGK
jgi:hypothetical protein